MDRSPFRRLARILWPLVSLWLVLAVAVALFSGLEIHADRSAAIGAARDETAALARAARSHVADALDQANHVLTLHKIVHERRLGAVPLATGDGPGDVLRMRPVDRYDRDGNLAAASDPRTAPASVADRAWFADARRRDEDGMQVGRPVAGAIPGTYLLPLARRLETPDGEFDGALVTFVDPAKLAAALRAIAPNGRVALGIADRHGTVVASTAGPAVGNAVRPLASSASAVPAAATDATVAGEPWMVARAELPGRELVVFAATSEDAALARHRRHARTTLVFAVLTLVAMTLAMVIVGRRALVERDRRRQLERRYEEVRNRARSDPLTSVSNRAEFDDRLRVAHAILAADGRPFVLAFIDIDRFKALNDRFGHASGDKALKRVAHLLRDGVRSDDTVSRLGGDEFAVLMPGGNALAMRRVFEPLRDRLNRAVADEKWPITFSIGVVAFESAPSRPRDAVSIADRVMYDVKSHGRDGVRYAIYRQARLVPDLEPPEKVAA